MKKRLLTAIMAFCLLLLGGCSRQETFSYEKVSQALALANEVELPGSDLNNAQKTYYTYYLSKGIGREEKNETSNVFIIYDSRALLTLDIMSIISSQYYGQTNELRSIARLSDPVFQQNFTTTDSSGNELKYQATVNEIDDSYCYITIQSKQFIFVATALKNECDEVMFEMVKILRSATVDREKVITDYSNYEEDNSTMMILSLFKQVLPESGQVIDYIDDWKDNPGFIIIEGEGENEGDDIPPEGEIDIIDDDELNPPTSNLDSPEDLDSGNDY